MRYIVALQHGHNPNAPTVRVTDANDGLGPDVYASYQGQITPILTIETPTAEPAGLLYLKELGRRCNLHIEYAVLDVNLRGEPYRAYEVGPNYLRSLEV